jgi:hypothetical protein
MVLSSGGLFWNFDAKTVLIGDFLFSFANFFSRMSISFPFLSFDLLLLNHRRIFPLLFLDLL